jgi:hypothetical protein
MKDLRKISKKCGTDNRVLNNTSQSNSLSSSQKIKFKPSLSPTIKYVCVGIMALFLISVLLKSIVCFFVTVLLCILLLYIIVSSKKTEKWILIIARIILITLVGMVVAGIGFVGLLLFGGYQGTYGVPLYRPRK